MATNCTDLVDMRDDDVYSPTCAQKIFGRRIIDTNDTAELAAAAIASDMQASA